MLKELTSTRAGRFCLVAAAVLAVVVAGALVVLWPGQQKTMEPIPKGDLALVRYADVEACTDQPKLRCNNLTMRILDGEHALRSAGYLANQSDFAFRAGQGDKLRVLVSGERGEITVTPLRFERSFPLLSLAVLFCGLVLMGGRWRGARALIGLFTSLVILVKFIVPAIATGESALLVALVGALAAALVTIPACHGLGAKSLTALLSTAVALTLTALLAVIFANWADLTGFGAGDDSIALQVFNSSLSLPGLVIAGMVIGALGVLDDVTVSQSSTVFALRRANSDLDARELYTRGLDVGRDHLAATVNTLVMSYAGATLPLLLLFGAQGVGVMQVLNDEAVAQSVTGMLVGSVGIIAALPLTTFIAAQLAVRVGEAALADDGGHHHH